MTHETDHLKTYIGVWAVLIVLTFVTVVVAEIDLGEWNIVLAMTIAVIKALLVASFFMHLKGSTRTTKLFASAAFFWMVILFLLTFGDYSSRGWLPVGRWW